MLLSKSSSQFGPINWNFRSLTIVLSRSPEQSKGGAAAMSDSQLQLGGHRPSPSFVFCSRPRRCSCHFVIGQRLVGTKSRQMFVQLTHAQFAKYLYLKLTAQRVLQPPRGFVSGQLTLYVYDTSSWTFVVACWMAKNSPNWNHFSRDHAWSIRYGLTELGMKCTYRLTNFCWHAILIGYMPGLGYSLAYTNHYNIWIWK